MYSKEQISKLKQAFWTTFGQYMSAVPAADGEKINWMNYKTGFKHLYFRMDADQYRASIAIEISHPDLGLQELFFEQFQTLKAIFYSHVNESWIWLLHTPEEHGKVISKITTDIQQVSVLERNDWPSLISFFKPRIIALDAFWSVAKYSFNDLNG